MDDKFARCARQVTQKLAGKNIHPEFYPPKSAKNNAACC
jgi:hypothetical protein